MRHEIIEILKSVGRTFTLNTDDWLRPIIGRNGQLDSLDFVRFLIAVETEVNLHFDTFVSLVDDKALSEKNSPFASLHALTNYIEGIINANNCCNRH